MDWRVYNEHRATEGDRHGRRMNRIADKARELMGIRPGARDRRVSAILLSVTKVGNRLSYWGLVNHLKKHPDYLRRCELDRQYNRSWYQLRISEVDSAVLQRLIPWMAGMDAAGTLSVDSSGFSVARYRDWENAKYGEISVRLFSKLHVIRALRGRICVATVTAGQR